MSVPVVLSPETAYATSRNIKFPGNQAQATAAETAAASRANDSLPSGVTLAVAGGTIKVAT